MALPADFSKIFGSTATGGLTPIGDVNYAKGWEFVGSNPPTKNDFSYLQNLSDKKSQWLYSNKLQRTDPFGDIKSDGAAAISKALSNLGLGGAARLDVGMVSGTVAAGDDSRFGLTIGVGQTWRDVASSRALNTTYTNSTGKPIFVSVTCANQQMGTSIKLRVGSVVSSLTYKGSNTDVPLSGIIPNGATYSVVATDGIITNWAELS